MAKERIDYLDYFSFQPEMKRYEIIDSVKKLKRLRQKMKELEEFSFDFETNTLRAYGKNKNFIAVGLSISWGKYDNYYIPMFHRREEDFGRNIDKKKVRKYLKDIFEQEEIRLIGANIKFDMHCLERIGISIKTKDLIDIQILSWLLDEEDLRSLKDSSGRFMGVNQTKFKEVINDVPKEVKKKFGLKGNNKASFDMTLIDDSAPYALDDAFYTWELYLGLVPLVEKEGFWKIYEKLFKPFLTTIFKMEKQGVTVDIEKLKKMQKEIKVDLENLEYKMFEIVGISFNPNSTQQLGELLFGEEKELAHPSDNPKWREKSEKEKQSALKKYEKDLEEKRKKSLLPYSYNFKVISRTDKGAPQINNDVLWKMKDLKFKNSHKQKGVELCNLLLEYKKLAKLDSAFISGMFDNIYDDDKIHPNFKIGGTTSGRLSCSSPNGQQMPKAEEEDKYKIRSMFIGSEYVSKDNEYVREYDKKTPLKEGEVIKRKKILALDYSNLEIRMTAHLSKDPLLLKMFSEGEDVHGSTAVNMFELPCNANEVKKQYPHLRMASKILNFLNQ